MIDVTLTSAAGDGHNQDWAIATPTAVIVLDGVTSPADMPTGCHHGVDWYVHQLGAALLDELPRHTELRDCLAAAIASVTASHAHTCDVTHGGTPSATVAIVREQDDAWDYLVLSDTTIILDRHSGLNVISDTTVDHVAVAELDASYAQQTGTPEHDERLHDLITAQHRLRNTPDGYWLAGSQPHAAGHAIVGSVARADIRRVAVLTDGAARLVEPFHLTDWHGLLDIVGQHGPQQLIHEIRDAEATDPTGQRWPRHKLSDDATVAYLTDH